jgi:hypothetical protein
VFPPPEIGVEVEVEALGADEDAEVDVEATEEERSLTTSAPPMVELAEGDAVADSLDDTAVVMTEASAETTAAELAIEVEADEVAVVMTDGSPETGAELTPASGEAIELSETVVDVTAAEATLDSSKPIEEALAIDEITDDGAAEIVPLPAVPGCEGFLHLPLPCPAAWADAVPIIMRIEKSVAAVRMVVSARMVKND